MLQNFSKENVSGTIHWKPTTRSIAAALSMARLSDAGGCSPRKQMPR